jgi:hypothetical protein
MMERRVIYGQKGGLDGLPVQMTADGWQLGRPEPTEAASSPNASRSAADQVVERMLLAAAVLLDDEAQRNENEQRAVEACDKLLDILNVRRCFRRYQGPPWDDVVVALEAVRQASQPASVRQARSDLAQARAAAEAPPVYTGNEGTQAAAKPPRWRRSLGRQMFAVEQAKRRSAAK